ncbi:MAG TPA: nitroreductase family deazaflavin-dependent oxidoreductase [Candidatus Solibacter sp.]|nr:nitroreductase family deazaflavin-dependent oxidoreductase [Candidatus Solibacter sp.]
MIESRKEVELMANWNQRMIDEFHAKGGLGITNFGDRLLLLTSLGARSGERRTTPVMYHPDNGNMVIVASKGGEPEHPGWYYNLMANPEAEVEVATPEGLRTIPVRAREAEGAERERIWADRVAIAPTFGEYQRKTSRRIPVIILEPTGASASR